MAVLFHCTDGNNGYWFHHFTSILLFSVSFSYRHSYGGSCAMDLSLTCLGSTVCSWCCLFIAGEIPGGGEFKLSSSWSEFV